MERWRHVQGYPEYQVSDLGKVRRRLKAGWRVLKPLVASNGYHQACLHSEGRGRRVLIHALVAAAFLGARPADAEVNHLSGNKADTRTSPGSP
jgi:hypothetical protein